MKYKISLDIARGVDYLHSCFPAIVHRDLRSPNIFMVSTNDKSDVVCKVGDFGLAQQVAPYLIQSLNSWQWIAPETFAEDTRYDQSSDIYSIAIILSEIFTGKRPFEDKLDFMIAIPVFRGLEDLLVDNTIESILCSKEWKVDFKAGTATKIEYEFDTMRIKTAIEEDNLRPTLSDDINSALKVLIETSWSSNPQLRSSSSKLVAELEKIMKEENLPFSEVVLLPIVVTPTYIRT